jgi:type IV secretory pathway VirB10-like protein
MWGFASSARGTKQARLEQERLQQEELIKQQLLKLELSTEIIKWQSDTETQMGLVNAAKRNAASCVRSDANANGKLEKSNMEQLQEAHDKKQYLAMARHGYEELVCAIIRPPRASYEVSEYGRN